MDKLSIPGFEIPGYKITEKLYESRSTVVYRGILLTIREPVILKILKPDIAAEKDETARFRHEYDIISKLNLSGVVKPVALEQYLGSLVMVVVDIGGESLDHFRMPLPVEEFLELAIALADTVEHVHKRQLIHKNINPSNIIWNPQTKQLNLIGLGIADEVPEQTVSPQAPSAIEGTLEYISPEQTGRMNRVVDYRTDFYSLGITFYQLLTGQLPFVASDALGIVHLHIAGTAQSPHELNPDIPEMVSRIVLKLISKMADDRYQSAWGLKADLELCFQEYFAKGAIRHFELGKEDFTDRLRVPQKLYGRKRETEQLLNAFERVSSGERELFLVAGYSGIGKTALVHEVHRPIAEKRGYFIEGKFDQLQRNVPYFAWIQAFTGFVNYLLMGSEAEVAQWRAGILNAVGGIGKVLTDVIPNLELIIGPQYDVPLLGTVEAQNRFNYVFLEFIRVIAIGDHPLVVFLDDLQWIDAASLNLLGTLMSSIGISNVLIIGAYRDNEVDALHPLTKRIESLRQEKSSVQLQTLGNLSEETVNEMIADTLHVEHSQTVPLTQLIYAKTGGNPFFMLQMLGALAERQVIWYDVQSKIWQWDISALKSMEITDNVVTLMLGKILKQAAETQHVLTLASCIGFRFSIANLSIIAEQSEESTLANLHPALREGLIIPLDVTFQFAHDRIQQAAYSLIPDADKKKVHLEIGRFLLEHISERDHEEPLFSVVDHLNIGAELIESSDEKLELARLNLRAGLKAKASAAYASALVYLAAGAALLTEDCWERRHDLVFSLQINQAECEFLTGEQSAAEQRLAALSIRAADMVEQAAVACLRVDLYTALGQNSSSIAVGLDYLQRLGIDWSIHPTEDDARREYERIWASLGNRVIEDLVALPLMSDSASLATQNVLTKLTPPAMFTDVNLFCLVICEAVNVSIGQGVSDGSCFAFVTLGMVAGPLFGDYKAGFRFGRLGYELVEQRGLKRFQVATYMTFGHFIMPWTKHVRAGRDLLHRVIEVAERDGDLIFVAYSANNLVTNYLTAGDQLVEVQRQAEYVLGFTQKTQFVLMVNIIISQLGLVRTLRGLTQKFGSFDDENFDEIQFEQHLSSKPDLDVAQCFYWIRVLQARFFSDDFAAAVYASGRVELLLWTVPSEIAKADYYFYSAMAQAAYYDRAPDDQRQQHFEALIAHHKQLEIWADNCPENFENRAALVGAELARIEGRDQDAMRLYEKAIASAHKNGFTQNEAIAYEAAASFYRQRGFDKFARTYMAEAVAWYSRWGALGKVRQLEYLHPWMTQPQQPGGKKLMEHLDLSTVMKTTQAISSEIELHRLLSEVMHSVIESAGAQNGFLLMEREGKWEIVTQGEIDRTKVEISRPISIEQGDIVSLGVVRFVARTHERVLLNDAANQGEFVSDPYVIKKGTKSLLCAPLLSRGRLIGILYLENNLTTYAFIPERVQFLEMLLSQAATSLENATIYEALKRNRDHLDEVVKERTSQLEVAKEQAEVAKEQAESANSAKSIFLANMSHELRTPLNAILGFSRLMKEGPDITEEQRKNLDIINVSGGHLLNLINNVLNMSKIESGRMTLEEAPLDLYQLIQEMKLLLYVNVEEQKLSFVVEQSSELPQHIEVDGGKLRQILINLIGNAIKYTKQGGVILRAMVVKREAHDKVRLRFEIEDTGPGISDGDKKRIFQPFVQLRGQGAIETGTGLGLAISRQYVDIMGGVVDVVSKKGKGSIFYFEVPAKELSSEEISVVPERGRVIGLEKGQSRYRLLIVEDQLENRILLHKILEPLGFDIREAVNGKNAVEIFEQWHPDLIWMDIRMPIMDGLEATHRIKAIDAGLHTKIIAITAQALEEDRMRIMEAGCDDFIGKPYRNTEIYDILSRHLGLRFVYEEKPVTQPIEPELDLKSEQLSVLPSDLIQQLHQAVLESDPEDINLLINRISALDPAICRALRAIADKFDYYRILKLLEDFKKE